MKQVININFQGRVVPIEVTAFDILKNYTDSLNRYFANEQGKEEIINDIESRIGELFQERLKSGATCISEDDVNSIIKSMGRPEDFDAAGAEEAGANTKQSTYSGNTYASFAATGSKKLFRDENDKVLGGVCSGLANYFGIDSVIVRIIFIILLFSGIGFLAYIIMWAVVPSTASTEIGSYRKKLYRDRDGKLIAGVCSGLAKYFGVQVWIPRLLFLIPFLSFAFRWNHWGDFGFPDFINLSFSPGSLIVYIILWLVIPEATTTSEKLEMKGEKVDMNSIKNSVVEEMKGVKDRAQKLSNEAAGIAKEKTAAMGADISSFARRNKTSFGDVIGSILKIIAYLIVGVFAILIVVALFFLAIAAVGAFPLKNFILNGEYQNLLAWGTLIFFIAVPVIGIITWIIRRITRVKSGNKNLAFAFTGLWILGWVCVTLLFASLGRDFRRSNNPREEFITLANANVNKLEITADAPDRRYFRRNWNRVDLFEALDKDSIFVKNVVFKIEKASSDSFSVSVMRMSRGSSRETADSTARNIDYSVNQKDSLIVIDKGIAITPKDKFRNQYVIVRVYVPVGKQILVDESVGRYNDASVGFYDEDDWDFDTKNTQRHWEKNTTYVMKEDGLYTLDGSKAGEDNNDWDNNNNRRRINSRSNNNNTGTYRYDSKDNDNNGSNSPAINKIDSIKQELKQKQENLRDSLLKLKEKADKELEKLDDASTGTTVLNSVVLPSYNPMM